MFSMYFWIIADDAQNGHLNLGGCLAAGLFGFALVAGTVMLGWWMEGCP